MNKIARPGLVALAAKLMVLFYSDIQAVETSYSESYEHQSVTLASLLSEMTDPYAAARLPKLPYESLQASSYNLASVRRDKPGWFAGGDGEGFIRTERTAGRTE